MDSIGAQDIQDHFDNVLEKVERGESIALTREGRHVATIIPASPSPAATKAVTARILARRSRIIEEGRGLSLSDITAARDSGRR